MTRITAIRTCNVEHPNVKLIYRRKGKKTTSRFPYSNNFPILRGDTPKMDCYAMSHEVNMHFPAHIVKEAHNALKEHCKKPENMDFRTDRVAISINLKTALELLKFKVAVNKDCSLTVKSREYGRVSIYQDGYFAALAPFVHSEPVGDEDAKQGGHIIWMGEDGRFWRDNFANGELTRQTAEAQFTFA